MSPMLMLLTLEPTARTVPHPAEQLCVHHLLVNNLDTTTNRYVLVQYDYADGIVCLQYGRAFNCCNCIAPTVLVVVGIQ